jgi:hypothetical protein
MLSSFRVHTHIKCENCRHQHETAFSKILLTSIIQRAAFVEPPLIKIKPYSPSERAKERKNSIAKEAIKFHAMSLQSATHHHTKNKKRKSPRRLSSVLYFFRISNLSTDKLMSIISMWQDDKDDGFRCPNKTLSVCVWSVYK